MMAEVRVVVVQVNLVAVVRVVVVVDVVCVV